MFMFGTLTDMRIRVIDQNFLLVVELVKSMLLSMSMCLAMILLNSIVA